MNNFCITHPIVLHTKNPSFWDEDGGIMDCQNRLYIRGFSYLRAPKQFAYTHDHGDACLMFILGRQNSLHIRGFNSFFPPGWSATGRRPTRFFFERSATNQNQNLVGRLRSATNQKKPVVGRLQSATVGDQPENQHWLVADQFRP